MVRRRTLAALAVVTLLGAGSVAAQQAAAPPAPPPPAAPYGAPILLDAAKRAVAAAEAEAARNGWNVVIAVVDSAGHLVMLHRMDGTQLASIRIAEGKARTALEFRRPSKALEDAVAAGGAGLRLLALDGVTPFEGGVLIQGEGRIVGAIGVSGVASSQDAQVARAGADAAVR